MSFYLARILHMELPSLFILTEMPTSFFPATSFRLLQVPSSPLLGAVAITEKKGNYKTTRNIRPLLWARFLVWPFRLAFFRTGFLVISTTLVTSITTFTSTTIDLVSMERVSQKSDKVAKFAQAPVSFYRHGSTNKQNNYRE